jgi:hypothetical protein
MSNRLRRILAVACALLLLSAIFSTGAMAQTRAQEDAANAPAAVDVLLLRPAGLVGLVVGTGLFLVTLPIVAITRPHEIGVPFNQLVAGPAKYVWRDPLGGH